MCGRRRGRRLSRRTAAAGFTTAMLAYMLRARLRAHSKTDASTGALPSTGSGVSAGGASDRSGATMAGANLVSLPPPSATAGGSLPVRQEPLIVVEGVEKAFGSLRALAAVDLVVERGTVLALLGRNGAGKSTLVRVLSTLLRPDAGRASIAGVDVVRDANRVRSLIGLAGQAAAGDPNLPRRENPEV